MAKLTVWIFIVAVVLIECLTVIFSFFLSFCPLLKMKGHYFLIVEAWDGAVDPRRSRLTLSVTVLDVDDNSPIFTQQTYNVSLPENSPKDTVILQLKVSSSMLIEIIPLHIDK